MICVKWGSVLLLSGQISLGSSAQCLGRVQGLGGSGEEQKHVSDPGAGAGLHTAARLVTHVRVPKGSPAGPADGEAGDSPGVCDAGAVTARSLLLLGCYKLPVELVLSV